MKSKIKFGPAGLGGVKEAISNLEKYKSFGFSACEIAFTYSAYIKKEDALKIGKVAKELGIQLSIHAHYWINLNSEEKEKVRKSKERILKCCEIGKFLGAKKVVFHPGYYGKKEKIETCQNIKREILELQKEIKKRNYKIKLAPETTGKVNVFGSIDEIKSLVDETGCGFCIDFAHILARYKKYMFKEVFEKFKDSKEFHIHFSGIEYGEKGERRHIMTPHEDLKKLIENLPKDKDITIINESPDPIGGSKMGLTL
ncbi:MAG: TIM barrel protein [Nanoarchaeota archaeon]